MVHSALDGRPGALLLHGEAGVGKTRLLADVCGDVGAGTQVLWGTCVQFGAASLPYAPLTSAVRRWFSTASEEERRVVASRSGDLSPLVPGMGTGPRRGPAVAADGVQVLDTAVTALLAQGPTVLVVDDLQWADQSSLDFLTYLVTGFGEQRLALLGTYRDVLAEGHPLHPWLADVRRLPGVSQLRLERFGTEETAAQVAALLGGSADAGFAAEVFDRSGGNPYLTELLLEGASADTTSLTDVVPEALRQALLGTWHGLSPGTRRVMQVVAVAGRPVPADILAPVSWAYGIGAADLDGCLREAVDSGVLVADSTGAYGPRHPLLGELLYDALLPGERHRMHSRFADVLEPLTADRSDLGLAVDLATHHDHAGHLEAAFEWSLRAAGLARDVHGFAEEAQHLQRVLRLWQQVGRETRAAAGDELSVVHRLSLAAELGGDVDAALTALEGARDLVDNSRDSLKASTVEVEQ